MWVCVHMCVCVHMHDSAGVEVREQLGELNFSFHYVEPGDETGVIRLDSKWLYLLIHLPSPDIFYLE